MLRRTVAVQSSIVGAVLGIVFAARFWLNLLQYGNAIVRVASEKPTPSIDNLIGNGALIFSSITSFTYHEPGTPLYATLLTGGLGVTGCIGIVGVVALVVRRQRLALLAAIVLCGVIVAAFLSPVYPWNFRYFLPGILVASVLGIAALHIQTRAEALLAILVLGGINACYLTWPGELNGNGGLDRALTLLKQAHYPIQRTFIASPTLRPIDLTGALRLERREPLRIVAFQDIGSALLPFQGSHAQHDIILTSNYDNFIFEVDKEHPDMAVYASPSDHPGIIDALRTSGYQLASVAPGYIVGILVGGKAGASNPTP